MSGGTVKGDFVRDCNVVVKVREGNLKYFLQLKRWHYKNKKAVLSQRWPRKRPIHGTLKIFGTPRLLFPTFFMGFCSDPPCECSFKIWNP